jgi:tetratricopeptide (TPR) repeat protein
LRGVTNSRFSESKVAALHSGSVDSQRMSSTEQLPALFGELERFVNQADYDKALKMCDKILHITADDQDALHCKLITFIRLERYSDALSLLSKKFKGDDRFLFERAYCLYRSNQLAQALEVIENAKSNNQQDVSTRHLEAQLVSSTCVPGQSKQGVDSMLISFLNRTTAWKTIVLVYLFTAPCLMK